MAKPLTVRYERLYSFGNHQHAKYAVEMQVEDGEDAQSVMDQARAIVKKAHARAATQDIAEIKAKAKTKAEKEVA